MMNKKSYSYWVVLSDTGKIESGWEFKEDAYDRKLELQQDGIKSVIRCGDVFRKKFATDDSQWHSGKLEWS